MCAYWDCSNTDTTFLVFVLGSASAQFNYLRSHRCESWQEASIFADAMLAEKTQTSI